jgi:tryptophanyl-tRNA synthetase
MTIASARRVMSLTDPTKKMSKSDSNPNSRVLITDDEDTIRHKFRIALTDSKDGISYDPENRPGVSNLLDILKHFKYEETSSHDIAAEFKHSSLRSLKEAVADAVGDGLRVVREKYMQLRSSSNLHHLCGVSQSQATATAESTLREVKDAIGLLRLSQ